MAPRSRLLLPVVLAVGVALGGCVDERRPEACDDDSVTVEVTVMADGMEPNPTEVCRSQAVTLVVQSQVDGVFHIHGLDDDVPATTIAAGQSITLAFSPQVTGQFPVELHPADNPQGIAIGVFTVHDR